MNRLRLTKKPAANLAISCLVLLLVLASARSLLFSPVYGAKLGNRSLTLTNNLVSTVATYDLAFSISTQGQLGSVQIEFCSNDALLSDVCTTPVGLDASTATIGSQSGQTGFSVSGSSTANNLILTRTAAPDTSGPVDFVLNNITNPSSPGSYYARVQTFASTDASGNSSDYGGIAFAINSPINVTATVPPYLLFCTGISIPNENCSAATGDYIDLGILSPNAANQGSSQMLTATNAASGYDISIYGTTLESGTNTIAAMSSPDVSRPGTGQFGINLRANNSPAGGQDPGGRGSGEPTPNYDTPNFYTFNSGDIIASYTQPDQDRLYTASYLVNVPDTQAPGVYATTLTYICVATF